MMNMRLVRPAVLIDVNRLASLARVEVMGAAGGPAGAARDGDAPLPRVADAKDSSSRSASPEPLGEPVVMGAATPPLLRGGLRLGALVRQQALERDPRIASAAPLLAEAAPVIGHLQTRARGTVGGSLVHADPAAELPACMVALDATFHLQSARGRRVCRADAF